MSAKLRRLRADLARVDDDLRRNIGRRLELARAIGRTKRDGNLPLRDLSVERRVVARWREGLEREGVPTDRAETLAHWLVEEAIRAQEAVPLRPLPASARRRVTIVGGAGAMGLWLCAFLRRSHHRVTVVDPRSNVDLPAGCRRERDLERAVRSADVVIVATPMAVAPEIYRRLVRLRPTAVVLDILSVKAPIRPWIRRLLAVGVRVASLHPMFGPRPGTLTGRPVLLVDCGDESALRVARELFERSSLELVRVPVDEHDRLTAELQVLPRVTALLFARGLAGAHRSVRELERLAPPSFQRQVAASRYVVEENPDLSFDLHALNPGSPDVYRRVDDALRQLRRLTATSQRPRYRRWLGDGRVRLARRTRAGVKPGPVSERTRPRRRARR